jgi:hypothetical protein
MKMTTLLDDIHPGEILQAAFDLRRIQRNLAATIAPRMRVFQRAAA